MKVDARTAEAFEKARGIKLAELTAGPVVAVISRPKLAPPPVVTRPVVVSAPQTGTGVRPPAPPPNPFATEEAVRMRGEINELRGAVEKLNATVAQQQEAINRLTDGLAAARREQAVIAALQEAQAAATAAVPKPAGANAAANRLYVRHLRTAGLGPSEISARTKLPLAEVRAILRGDVI